MQKQGQRQQFRVGRLFEQGREPGIPSGVPCPQFLNVAYGHEAVLIDGVLMVEIARDLGLDASELGKEGLQDPQFVHFGQGPVEAGPGMEEFHDRSRLGMEAQAGGQLGTATGNRHAGPVAQWF